MFDVPGTRFTLMGDWDASPEPAGRVVLRLHPDNGQVYDPTSPATTAMLQAMEQADLVGKSVLDFGTGSGILAVAAEKLGASEFRAIDHNPVALDVTDKNIKANPGSALRVLSPIDDGESYDVILANVGDGDLVATLIDRCDLLIASVPKARKRIGGKQGEKPVYAKSVQDVADARAMQVRDIDPDFSIVVG